MFGLMKNVIKESPVPQGPVTLAELHAGCIIGLGFMPQKNVSGKRIAVTEVNSYLFTNDSFVAYRLVSDEADVNLIVADEEDPTGTYLALSQRIEPRQFDAIFPGHAPLSWFALKEGESLAVQPPALGATLGWLATRYTVAVITGGRYLEGDYRLRKAAERTRLSRPFDYVLLVDEDNEYALEVEKYEDGTLQVFATIYRPATDIGEITRAPRSGPSITQDKPAESSRLPAAASSSETDPVRPLVLVGPVETIPHISPLESAKPVQEGIAAATDSEQVLASETPVPEASGTIPHVPPVAKTEEAPLPAAIAEVKPEPEFPETKEVLKAEETVKVEEPKLPLPEEVVLKSEELKAEEAKLVADVEEVKEREAESPDPSAVPEVKPENAPEISAALTAVAEAVMSAAEAAPEEAPEIMPEAPAVYSKFGRIQPAASNTEEGDTLTCDARLASRLIDEAQRNQMALSELIRKVIDLPARVQDKVMIPFALDPSEAAELARRYHLQAGDMQGVKEQIVEELKRFAGEKV